MHGSVEYNAFPIQFATELVHSLSQSLHISFSGPGLPGIAFMVFGDFVKMGADSAVLVHNQQTINIGFS